MGVSLLLVNYTHNTMNKEIDKALHLIYTLQEQFFNMPHREGCLKMLYQIRSLMEDFDSMLTPDQRKYGIYSNAYKEIFANGTGLSQYDKICATICEEEYAELPF